MQRPVSKNTNNRQTSHRFTFRNARLQFADTHSVSTNFAAIVVTKYHLSDIAAWSSAELSVFEDNFSVKTFQGDEFLIDKKDGKLEIKDGVGETAGFKEVDILTCQGYVHVIDKVLFYDDADGSDGALGKAVGLAAGAVALGAALL